jgi:hypothetical protein
VSTIRPAPSYAPSSPVPPALYRAIAFGLALVLPFWMTIAWWLGGWGERRRRRTGPHVVGRVRGRAPLTALAVPAHSSGAFAPTKVIVWAVRAKRTRRSFSFSMRTPLPPPPWNEGLIDNLIMLATCGFILAVAIHGMLMERQEVAPSTAASPPRMRR